MNWTSRHLCDLCQAFAGRFELEMEFKAGVSSSRRLAIMGVRLVLKARQVQRFRNYNRLLILCLQAAAYGRGESFSWAICRRRS